MKVRRPIIRSTAFVLTLALLLGLLSPAFAAVGAHGERPDELDFKIMGMDTIRQTPLSKYAYDSKDNNFYGMVDMNVPDAWVKLTYVIEKSQPLSLALYWRFSTTNWASWSPRPTRTAAPPTSAEL